MVIGHCLHNRLVFEIDPYHKLCQSHPFNLCTKCVNSLGIIHNRTPDCHPVSWAWSDDLIIECIFILQATWVIDVIGLFVDMLPMVVCL